MNKKIIKNIRAKILARIINMPIIIKRPEKRIENPDKAIIIHLFIRLFYLICSSSSVIGK